jgi:ABC-type enterobactin transport system permease subunit
MTLAILLLGIGALGFLAAVTSSEGGPAPAFYLVASPLVGAIGLGFWGAGSLMRRGSAWKWVAQVVLPIVAPIILWPALGLLR